MLVPFKQMGMVVVANTALALLFAMIFLMALLIITYCGEDECYGKRGSSVCVDSNHSVEMDHGAMPLGRNDSLRSEDASEDDFDEI